MDDAGEAGAGELAGVGGAAEADGGVEVRLFAGGALGGDGEDLAEGPIAAADDAAGRGGEEGGGPLGEVEGEVEDGLRGAVGGVGGGDAGAEGAGGFLAEEAEVGVAGVEGDFVSAPGERVGSGAAGRELPFDFGGEAGGAGGLAELGSLGVGDAVDGAARVGLGRAFAVLGGLGELFEFGDGDLAGVEAEGGESVGGSGGEVGVFWGFAGGAELEGAGGDEDHAGGAAGRGGGIGKCGEGEEEEGEEAGEGHRGL